jgi:hypothetical protein
LGVVNRERKFPRGLLLYRTDNSELAITGQHSVREGGVSASSLPKHSAITTPQDSACSHGRPRIGVVVIPGSSLGVSLASRPAQEFQEIGGLMKMCMCWRDRVLLAGLALFGVMMLGSRIDAQAFKAAISGRVTDSSGAAVGGAKVNVKDVGTNATRSVATDPQGRYNVADLEIGTYEVQAEMTGFKKFVHGGLLLTVGTQVVVDIALEVGTAEQTISVEGQVPQVDTTSSAIGNLIEPTQMQELPLNGRNYTQLLTLAPGVQTGLNPPSEQSSLYGREAQYSVAGSRLFGQEFLLDNTNTAGFWGYGTGSGSTGESLGVEAIAEFRTLTDTYSAQYGGAGAVLDAVSKSGTNDFHGSAYEFLRNSALDARNYFDPATIPEFRRNQFGGSLGGPIKKNRAFFFVNYEGLRQALGVSTVVDTPDASARAGLLPDCVLNVPPAGCSPTQLDPLPAGPFNNAGAVSPSVISTLALYPLPSAATEVLGSGVATGVDQYTQVNTEPSTENYLLSRFDYTFSPKDSVFGRYVLDRGDLTLPSRIPLWPETDKTRSHIATIEERHLAGSNLANLARFSFVRPAEFISPSGPTHSGLQFYSGEGFPDGGVNVSGLTSIGAGTAPSYLIPNHIVVGDDVIWTRGSHSLAFGMSVERLLTNSSQPNNEQGSYAFFSLLGFLQGQPGFYVGTAPGIQNANGTRDFRELFLAPYFQDDWKVTPNLTLNIGLRYDFETNPTERRDVLFTLVNPPAGNNFVRVPNVVAHNPSAFSFDPRFGLAYDPFSNHKTAIRAGFGIFHDVMMASKYAPGYWLNPPFVTLATPFPPVYGSASQALAGVSPGKISPFQGFWYQSDSTPYMMQYNLNIQRDLGAGMILGVGYVGSRGVHLYLESDLNPPCPTPANNPLGWPNTTSTTPGCPNALATRVTNPVFATYVPGSGGAPGSIVENIQVNPIVGSLENYRPNGTSNYNSLQVSLNHRLSHGAQAQVSYTYSKSLDLTSDAVGLEAGAIGGGGGDVTNPYDLRSDYGPSSFDRRHNFTVSSVYALPFQGNRFIEGWEVSGILSAVSGFPFSVNTGFDVAGLNDAATERVTLASNCTPKSAISGNVNQWYIPSCFTLPAVGTIGTLGRGALLGPGLFSFDMALAKETKISERLSAQFRAEFFNIIDHTNLADPNVNEFSQGTDPNTGALVPIVNGNAGQIIATATTSRQIQFALKFIF